ncbi:pectate lyase family protein [Burkholderia sp. MSMB0856]|uniref:pectate lyase family protein n=1 Tax=Burkholderia sp. MSMB0856 TaxID=1637869 RepID=UPI000D3AFC3B|nr:hypothetical protein [Burkholderia sp. MSMB0856]
MALADYALTGFSLGNTGGGVLPEVDPAYLKIYTTRQLAEAIQTNRNYKVLEIMNDLDLGWNEISDDTKAVTGSKWVEHPNRPLTHPVLIRTGVSRIYLDDFRDEFREGRSGLTIFSANGAKLRHATFDIRRSSNVIIRNIEFDELWEWDEATKGDYDLQDWDYITLQDCKKVWIDHCTFHKSYDGTIDVKAGTSGVTISWCMLKSDDLTPNSWVTQQLRAMDEPDCIGCYPMYDFIRRQGLANDDIAAVIQGQKKVHLVGATPFEASNAALEVTLHHNYYKNAQDRMPRLRAGNAHAFNIVMDCRDNYLARSRISSSAALAIAAAGYHFDVISNGAISTEGGAALIEDSYITGVRYPIRNNQSDPNDTRYTGKIHAVDLYYILGDNEFHGSSDSPGSPLAPMPAPVIPFSWNGFSQLPYTYRTWPAGSIVARLTSLTEGAGSGIQHWPPQYWMQTTY